MKNIRMALVAIMAASVAAGNPVLDTDTMRVEFGGADDGFGLRRIVNKAAGSAAFVAPKKGETDLWELRIVGKGDAGTNETITISNHAPCNRSFSHGNGRVALAWRGIDLPGEKKALDVFVEVKGNGELTYWSITSKTASKRWALHTTVFPYVRHVVSDGEADVLLPWKNMGARLVKRYDSSKERPHLSYSPSCKPPMMAFFKDDAMLYIAAHDPHWRFKEMRYRPGNDFFFATEAENSGVIGKAEGSPRGGFVMGCAKGDWWQAARFYREWALKQKWCAKGRLAQRDDFTRKAAEVDLWTLNHGSAQVFSNQVAAMAKAWPDLSVSAKWQRLSAIGESTDQNCLYTPEWLPLRPGVTETVAWAKKLGFLVMPYTNGRIWEQELASWTLAEPYACMTPNGDRRTEIYVRIRRNAATGSPRQHDGIEPRIRRFENGHRYGVMCPSCPQWHKVVAEVTRKLVDGEPFVNAVYIDQVSCSAAYPCRDPAHGHPLGGGRWWNDGLRTMMAPIHEEAHRKNIVLTSEQFGDYVLDYFDAFLNATEHCAEDVPFFPAVYSGYAIYYGTEVHWKDDDAARFAMCARTFTWGVANGWIPGYEIANPAFATHAQIYGTFGRARKSARDYLAYGSLVDELRPLEPIPRCTFTWWRTEAQRGKATYTNDLPAVIGSVWRDASGEKAAVVAVNVSQTGQTVKFRSPTGRDGLSARKVAGQPPPTFSSSGGIATLALAPRQIAILEQAD